MASLTHAAPLDVAQITVQVDQPKSIINPNIYGQFAEHLGHCIYEGLWVGEDSPIPNTNGIRNDVVAALKQLDIPVLRWPGGCFADEYHWKDGIGPRDKRPEMINTNWGAVTENNHFGTHEFFELAEQLGTKVYISGNVGSGTVQELMEWVEYMTSDADSPMANLRRENGRDAPWQVQYFGVGNESWGCGGSMRPEYYADLYRRYNTFVKNYSGNKIERIACGANAEDYNWTKVMMERAGRNMDGLSLHYYTLPTGSWTGSKGVATGFSQDEWHTALWRTLKMDPLIDAHSAVMDSYDPEKRVDLVVDEWGTWYDVEPDTKPGFLYQQNSIRDALVAALNFNIFHKHTDRVRMANIAQMVNVLQAMVLTDDERMLVTPTYHVFEMYKVHMGATHLPLTIESEDYVVGEHSVPSVDATASLAEDGALQLSLVNLRPDQSAEVSVQIVGLPISKSGATARTLTADALDAHNTFDQPDLVHPVAFDGFKIEGDLIHFTLPAKSVTVLILPSVRK